MSAVLDSSLTIGHRASAPAAPRRDADFVALFARYESRLLTFCRSIVRDEHDACDALQNTAVRALAGVRSDAVHTNPRAWLFAIARNESLTLLRRRREAAALDGGEVSTSGDPEARVIAREAFAELIADLEALPPQARQALVLREAAGFDYGEIARILDCGAGAARQAVSEARTALKADREARGADCASIRELLDAADGRRRRSRSARAHLRGCAACREWQASRPPRRARRLALPPVIGLGWLQALLAGGRLEMAISAISTPPRGVATALAATVAVGAVHAEHRTVTGAPTRPTAVVATATATATAAPVRTAAAPVVTAAPVATASAGAVQDYTVARRRAVAAAAQDTTTVEATPTPVAEAATPRPEVRQERFAATAPEQHHDETSQPHPGFASRSPQPR